MSFGIQTYDWTKLGGVSTPLFRNTRRNTAILNSLQNRTQNLESKNIANEQTLAFMIDRIQVLENRLNSLTTDEPEGTIFT